MASKRPRIEGVNQLGKNARAMKGLTRADLFKGLVAGGLLVKKDAQKETPVRSGNLRSGAYIATPDGVPDAGGGFTGDDASKLKNQHDTVIGESKTASAARSRGSNAAVAIGFTPFYALSVHENPRAGAAGYEPSKDIKGLRADRVHSKRGGWKFLEKAMQGSTARVLQAITAAARLPSGSVRST